MKPMGIIPSLLTLGNAVCGFTAIYKIAFAHVQPAPGILADPHAQFSQAAWLILLAMIFDALDGRVARLTKQTSDFGGQLDSLSDAVSFGIAPALLVAVMNQPMLGIWSKATWFFSLVFALSTILRLARYNVEAKRGAQDPDTFKGLPSPAAAGGIATLVILSHYMIDKDNGPRLGLLSDPSAEALSQWMVSFALPVAALGLGYLMVSSKVCYVHVFNKYLSGKRSFEYFAVMVFLVFIAAIIPEFALAAGFSIYVASGPLQLLRGEIRRRRSLPETTEDDTPRRPAKGA